MENALATARRILVVGIKPESRAHLDAHQIPLYLQKVGYDIIPSPTRYPEAVLILGVAVERDIASVSRPIDIVNVFCRPVDLAPRVSAIIDLRPPVVWFQSGLCDGEHAQAFVDAGLAVAHDCIGCRRATIAPSYAPLPGQRRR